MTAETAQPTISSTDREWLGEHLEPLLPELYGAAVRLCRQQADAEDLVAECVTRALANFDSLKDREAFRGWLFTILNNTFISQRRTARSKAEHEPLDTTGADNFSLFERLHQPILLWWGNPEMDFLNRLLREDLEQAIDALPDPYRMVVVMVDIQGLAYREAAETLDVPIGTVRSRLARGRGLLQEELWDHAVESGLKDGPPPSHHSRGTDESN